MAGAKVFLGGLPTGPDVKRLIEQLGEINPGRVITYDETCVVVGVKRDSHRLRSLVTAWRRRLYREMNYVFEAVPGQGLRRVTEEERSKGNALHFRRRVRGIRRDTADQALVDTSALSPKELRAHDHRRRVQEAATDALSRAVKEIASPPAVKALPRAVHDASQQLSD